METQASWQDRGFTLRLNAFVTQDRLRSTTTNSRCSCLLAYDQSEREGTTKTKRQWKSLECRGWSSLIPFSFHPLRLRPALLLTARLRPNFTNTLGSLSPKESQEEEKTNVSMTALLSAALRQPPPHRAHCGLSRQCGVHSAGNWLFTFCSSAIIFVQNSSLGRSSGQHDMHVICNSERLSATRTLSSPAFDELVHAVFAEDMPAEFHGCVSDVILTNGANSDFLHKC